MPRLVEDMPLVLARMAKAIPRAVDDVARGTFMAVDRRVVSTTAVDEGHARSNWVATINAPFPGQIPPYLRYPKRTDPTKAFETANRDGAIAQATGVANAFRSDRHDALYLANNTNFRRVEPYLDWLEYGGPKTPWSEQFPTRFFARGVAEGVATFRLHARRGMNRVVVAFKAG